FISPDFMDSLSDEDAEAIRSVSGEKLSIMAGKAWDKADTEALEYAREKDANIQELSADDPIAVAYEEKMQGLDQEWLDRVADKKGVDAKAALDMIRAEAQEYAEKNQ